jgi:beta-N-acetylglucosaminidase
MNKSILRGYIIALVIFAASIFSNNVQAVSLEAITWIDEPTANATLQNLDLPVRGWALNPSGIKGISVYLNDTFLGQATTGISRPDVNSVHPGYPNGDKSGYAYTISNSVLISGVNKITVEAEGVNGTKQRQQTSVNIIKPEPRFSFDEPNNSEVFFNKNVVVRGWALNATGIKSVKVFVNDVYKANATLNISRQDVALFYPMYPNAAKSGFQYTLDTTSIPVGFQKISIEVEGNDGAKQTAERTVRIQKKEFRANLDEPAINETITDRDTIVRGWAINDMGIKGIRILLDGQYLGNATLGYERRDVNNIYPGYPSGNNSGFQYVIPNDNVSAGTHKITAEVEGNDGIIKKLESQFTKKFLPQLMNVDEPSNNSIANNTSVKVRGWAIGRKGIKAVNIYVDGKFNGNAAIGLSRPDVGMFYPNYINSSTSGFEYLVDVNTIAPGTHKILVEVEGNDGTKTTSERSFQLKKKNPIIWIDEPGVNNVIKGSSIKVKGWAASDSTMKEVKIYLDGVERGSASIGLSRPDVNIINPGYITGDNSGFEYILDTNGLSKGVHFLCAEGIAADGTRFPLQINVIMFGIIEYVSYPNTFDYYLNNQLTKGANTDWQGNPVGADQVAYYMNPENFINNDQALYMFLKLSYTEGITAADLDRVLANKGILSGKGSVFLEAGRINNVNPIYLVSHALLETGNGTSALANGILVKDVHTVQGDINSALIDVPDRVTYNVYGIGAFNSGANLWGSERAYNEGWFTVDEAIIRGAGWISTGYIQSEKYKQNTLYKMKYNLDPLYIWHEYSTDVAWAYKQTSRIKNLVDQMSNPVLYFEVPLFKK